MTMTNRSRFTTLAIAAVAAFTFAGAGAAQAAPPATTTIPMNTGQEVPAPTVGGAQGRFSFVIDGDELCYTLSVSGLSAAPVAAHIHVAPRNVPGPIVVPLATPPAATSVVSACTTADPALLADIDANGMDYYVNVHTPMNMPGEVRGQLR